jgi:hypothetical protein
MMTIGRMATIIDTHMTQHGFFTMHRLDDGVWSRWGRYMGVWECSPAKEWSKSGVGVERRVETGGSE